MQPRHLSLLLLAAFGLACLAFVPLAGIGASWRECDTQAMSLSLATESFDVMRPRIDWRGDTDGGVESEMPLYQAVVALVLLGVGDVEWPGRIVSLLSVMAAALALHAILRRATSSASAAAVGVAAFLASGAGVLTACRVMPDAFSLAAGLVGWDLLDRWLRGGRGFLLPLATLVTALGCLAKPTTLQVVMVQAGWILASAPRLFPRPAAVVHLALPCIATLAWMFHAHGIHRETGLTFGVLAEGDSKLPHLAHLLAPGLHFALARNALLFGPGIVGYLAFLVLLLRKRLELRDAAVLVPMGLALVATMRYSASADSGPHYHLWAAVGGGWTAARCWPLLGRKWLQVVLGALLLATAGASLLRERSFRGHAITSPVLELAAALRRSTAAEDRVVIRSAKQQHDSFWNRPNNHEDPIVLYQSRRKGWVLPRDGWSVVALEELRARGARAVVDQATWEPVAPVANWLGLHGTEILATEAGRVCRLMH